MLQIDQARIWHPYAPMPGAVAPLPVVAAQGVDLTLADGRTLIDGMSSWWSAIHGYRHPALDAAARTQLDRMSHVMFGGLTHEPAIGLAQRLVELAPSGLDHVFFADSGSVSVEIAIKMCLQASPGRSRFLALTGGYHGDTFGAMSVTDPIGGMHSQFRGVLPQHLFANRPPAELDTEYEQHIIELVERHAHELAGVIVEPVVQGAGGMWFYDPALLRLVRELCDAHDVPLVFDEIATGFGRTGAMFAAEHAAVAPDVMCVGKALTGGYLTLAATLCGERIVGRLGDRALMHGPTFMANPLACAVAIASVDLLVEGLWKADVARLEGGLRRGLAPAAQLPGVNDVRVLGGIGVVQLDHPVNVPAATEAAVGEGVWLRPFNDLIYTMPPYISTDEDIAAIGRAVVAAAGTAA